MEGVNENGQYRVDICAERGLSLSNTFFQHKMIHGYTWARGNERRLIDYIAVDNRLRREVEDAKVVGGLFSDSVHFAVVVKVRMRCGSLTRTLRETLIPARAGSFGWREFPPSVVPPRFVLP